jgi:hypothetical protein
MKDKLIKLFDEPLFLLLALLGLYITWTCFNGRTYNKPLKECCDSARDEWERHECFLIYDEQNKDYDVGQ